MEKYEKVESINIQNDYETTSKKWTDKKKATGHNEEPAVKSRRLAVIDCWLALIYSAVCIYIDYLFKKKKVSRFKKT